MPSPASPPLPPAAPLCIALVGTGLVARNFVRDLRAFGHEIAGVVSGSATRGQEFAAAHGLAAFPTLTALKAAHPRCSVALVVNANDQHAAATLEALALGLHVFCEKPMAPTLAESETMVAAARASLGSLQINFEYIQSTIPRRLLELRDAGFFGELLSASCIDSRGHWWSVAPDADVASIAKLQRARGGGTVFHCGIHQLDMLRTCFGGFVEITAHRAARNALPYYPADVPDHVLLVMRTAAGAHASLEIFHNRAPTFYRRVPGHHPHWPSVPGHEFRLSLVGDAGSCLADFYGAKLHLFRFDHAAKDTDLERTEDYAVLPQNELHHDMTGFLRRYLENLRRTGRPLVDPSDALATMRLAFAAEKAIESPGRPVAV